MFDEYPSFDVAFHRFPRIVVRDENGGHVHYSVRDVVFVEAQWMNLTVFRGSSSQGIKPDFTCEAGLCCYLKDPSYTRREMK